LTFSTIRRLLPLLALTFTLQGAQTAAEVSLRIPEVSQAAFANSARLSVPSPDPRVIDIYLAGANSEIQLSSIRVTLNQMPIMTLVSVYSMTRGARASVRLAESINPDMKLKPTGENVLAFEAMDSSRTRYTGQFFITVGTAATSPLPAPTITSTRPAITPIDVDVNIPKTAVSNPDAVAVLIGISRYKNGDVPPVDYARRDAMVMKQYLVNTLGFDERRIIELYDDAATLSAFKRVFEEQLPNWIRAGRSDVFVFYSGHGAPSPETKEGFFVPYDCDPSYARSTGYKVSEFYSRLAALDVRTITVVIDACFSGSSEKGMLLKGISPIFINVENATSGLKNGLVFTSSSGQQIASWYAEKQHGLFTYYFLKGWRGDADSNQDRQITADEMNKYLLVNVPDQARYLNNREQTPQMVGQDRQRVLVRY
jgi:hypothetical protein